MQNETTITFGVVSAEDMATWCSVLRDSNAIHLSKQAAQQAGFGPNRVNPGPANLAYIVSAYLHSNHHNQIGAIKAIFNENVFEEDQLHITLRPDANNVNGALYRQNASRPAVEVTITEVYDV